ncbi:hypothetical protein PQX77_018704 [Marasmius sp. AFHP31]|nr:hypothetical protein PQX77_018704 [Marasmius sp. AFHP31]
MRVWTSRSIIHTTPYSAVPLNTNGDATKEWGKENLLESSNDSPRPLRLYNHQRKPFETHYTPPLSFDNSYSEYKEEEGEDTEEEEDTGSRSPAILRAQAAVGALRANFRIGIVGRQPKVKALLKRRKRKGELNSQHSSQGEPGNNPLAPSPTSSDSSDDVPFSPRSTGTPVFDSPSPLSIKNHPPSSFGFPNRSDSSFSHPPSVASSTTTAPFYSGGPYHRARCDSLASNQTYETLPSYHSRRSTQTFTDSDISDMPFPTTPRTNIRPLPPLPSSPPFVS